MKRARILGRLTPTDMAAGLTVQALDAGGDGFRRSVLVVVKPDGSYEIPADPGRLYRLFVEPTPDRRVPRIPLIPVRARATDLSDEQRLPRKLTVRGSALGDGMPIPGAVIQVFCVGNAPDCLDPEFPDVSNTPPIDETVSGPDGKYELYVPEPS